jgi:hypothetical protein
VECVQTTSIRYMLFVINHYNVKLMMSDIFPLFKFSSLQSIHLWSCFLMVQGSVQVHSHARSDTMHDRLARREVDLDEDTHTSKFRNVRID